jgi:hypothetical protein
MKPKLIIWILLFSIFGACSPVFYQPNTINIPLLSEEEEHRFSLNYINSEANGFEMQYAGTIGPSMALMINGMYVSKPEGSDFYGYGSLIEGGLGFYHPMGSKWSFNLFGGGGLGRAALQTKDFNQAMFGYQRYFAQPSIGIRLKSFEAGLGLRVSGLIYNIENNSLTNNEARAALIEFSRKTLLLVEPGLMLRYGFENVKLQVSLNDVRWLNKAEFSNDFTRFMQGSISVGIILRFGRATLLQEYKH